MTVREPSAPGATRPRLWTPAFLLLCVTMLLGYAHHSIMTPTVPLYVDEKGGSATLAGLALLAFSLPSVSVRPFLGRMADAWNAAAVLSLGLVLLALGGLLFLVPVLAMVFVASAVRGVGWGGLNTGGYTALAGVAPAQRRGEASGYYTSWTGSAAIFFPAIALWLVERPHGFTLVFLISALLAAIGLPLALKLVKMVAAERKATPQTAAAEGSGGLIAPGVLLATGLSLCSTLASPAVTAFLPLYARSQNIGDIGFYYVIAGITGIIIRPILGQRSDAIGRGPSIALGLACQFLGLMLIVLANGLGLILVGAVFMSLGTAMNGAATTALAMDLAEPSSRGKSMATFSISFQLGAGVGAMLAGALADSFGYRGMYLGAMGITLLGFGLLSVLWKSLPRPNVAAA